MNPECDRRRLTVLTIGVAGFFGIYLLPSAAANLDGAGQYAVDTATNSVEPGDIVTCHSSILDGPDAFVVIYAHKGADYAVQVLQGTVSLEVRLAWQTEKTYTIPGAVASAAWGTTQALDSLATSTCGVGLGQCPTINLLTCEEYTLDLNLGGASVTTVCTATSTTVGLTFKAQASRVWNIHKLDGSLVDTLSFGASKTITVESCSMTYTSVAWTWHGDFSGLPLVEAREILDDELLWLSGDCLEACELPSWAD